MANVSMQANFGGYHPMASYRPDDSWSKAGAAFAQGIKELPGAIREGQKWGEEMDKRKADKELNAQLWAEVDALNKELGSGDGEGPVRISPPKPGQSYEEYKSQVESALRPFAATKEGRDLLVSAQQRMRRLPFSNEDHANVEAQGIMTGGKYGADAANRMVESNAQASAALPPEVYQAKQGGEAAQQAPEPDEDYDPEASPIESIIPPKQPPAPAAAQQPPSSETYGQQSARQGMAGFSPLPTPGAPPRNPPEAQARGSRAPSQEESATMAADAAWRGKVSDPWNIGEQNQWEGADFGSGSEEPPTWGGRDWSEPPTSKIPFDPNDPMLRDAPPSTASNEQGGVNTMIPPSDAPPQAAPPAQTAVPKTDMISGAMAQAAQARGKQMAAEQGLPPKYVYAEKNPKSPEFKAHFDAEISRLNSEEQQLTSELDGKYGLRAHVESLRGNTGPIARDARAELKHKEDRLDKIRAKRDEAVKAKEGQYEILDTSDKAVIRGGRGGGGRGDGQKKDNTKLRDYYNAAENNLSVADANLRKERGVLESKKKELAKLKADYAGKKRVPDDAKKRIADLEAGVNNKESPLYQNIRTASEKRIAALRIRNERAAEVMKYAGENSDVISLQERGRSRWVESLKRTGASAAESQKNGYSGLTLAQKYAKMSRAVDALVNSHGASGVTDFEDAIGAGYAKALGLQWPPPGDVPAPSGGQGGAQKGPGV